MRLPLLSRPSHWYIRFTELVVLLMMIAIVAATSGCVQPAVVAPSGTQRVIYVRTAQQKADIEARQIAAMRAAIVQMCSDSAMRDYSNDQLSAYQLMCGLRTANAGGEDR